MSNVSTPSIVKPILYRAYTYSEHVSPKATMQAMSFQVIILQATIIQSKRLVGILLMNFIDAYKTLQRKCDDR